MFSIRKTRVMMLVAGVGMMGGCEAQIHPKTPGPEALSSYAIPSDPAMEKRQWDVSFSKYGNDAVLAHPTYELLEAKAENYEINAVTEPVFFVGNVAYIPVGAFIEFPWKFEINKSVSAPPTYTLMPPLPDGAEIMPTY